MAVVTKKSTVFGALVASGGYQAPNSASAKGLPMRIAGRVSNEATDQTGSKYLLCEVPSSAIMLPESAIRTTAWGFAQAVVGVEGAPDGLLDVTRATGGATGNNPITIFTPNWNVPIWQQMGLASDPLKPVQIWVVAEADATGAGTIDFDLQFANHV